MIHFSNINDACVDLYDKVLCITNTMPYTMVGVEHYPQLSPNKEDFISYKSNRIGLSELLDNYNRDLHDGLYNKHLNRILKQNEAGIWLQLLCYCKDYTKCHRYTLYKYLKELDIPNVDIL